jgi:nucleoside-diphosphate-sugar epimerase
MAKKSVLITGASGFIGKALCKALLQDGWSVYGTTRSHAELPPNIQRVDWGGKKSELVYFPKVDVVVHLAARTRATRKQLTYSEKLFQVDNVEMTNQIALWALRNGVSRFVFMSTIKVHGEASPKNESFGEDDELAPADEYAISKRDAEAVLRNVCRGASMDYVIIRPSIVYGPGVEGNFRHLVRLVKSGLPIPFGNIQNERSYIALDNIVSFTKICITHPTASNQIFLVSDGCPYSTTDLIIKIAKAYGVRSRIFSLPLGLLFGLGYFFGQAEKINRIFGSLVINDSRARELLDWKPVVTLDEQLRKMSTYDSLV